MSENTNFLPDSQAASNTALSCPDASHNQIPLPSFSSKAEAENVIMQNPSAWEIYTQFPTSIQQELIDFCTGKQGLKITYDPVFRKIFDPYVYPERLESILSSILERNVKIISIMPRESSQMNEQTSFVIMDVLVRLADGSYANVEMQKIGYNFPLARADCYAADIIMRQYAQVKIEKKNKFSFKNMHKVFCVILMERSPEEFHSIKNKYIHRRTSVFDTSIYTNASGLHEDIFICLDSFRSIVHTITKDSSKLEAWLTFLSATKPDEISALIQAFPVFAPIYQEITDFCKNPKELMSMLSEALFIMDKNMERLMVEELQEKVDAAEAKADAAEAKADAAEAKLQKILAFAKAHGYQDDTEKE